LKEALIKAREQNLDLVLITAKANPPVCRITEAGKFLYQKKKEQKKTDTVESKKLKIKFNTSEHDMTTRVNQAKKFLIKGDRIQLIMMLRGRENALRNQAEEKMKGFIAMIEAAHPVKVENQTSRKSKIIQYEVIPDLSKKHES
jgi:translation initiation factor IF-3